MKARIGRTLRWLLERSPEILLGLFVLSLLPLAVLILRGLLVEMVQFFGGPAGYLAGWGQNVWRPLAAVVCLLGSAALLYILITNWTPIWASARKMILEALHRRVVIVLLVFFAVLMPILPFALKTEGSVKSQVQLVLLYSLVLALVLLSLLAIFTTTASICSEVERRYVHITDTKPMRRWQFLLGKWFGVVVMCTSVLIVMTGGTFLLVAYVARPPDVGSMRPDVAMKAQKEWNELALEVFVARKAVKAPLPDFREQARQEAMEELERKQETLGRWAMNSYMVRRERELLYKSQAVVPGTWRAWPFAGLEKRQGEVLHVRFKPHSTDRNEVLGRWEAFHRETVQGSRGKENQQFRRVWAGERQIWGSNATHEIEMPSNVVNDDGTLWLRFQNMSLNSHVIFDIQQPVQIMQREGGFLPNYYRSLLILVVHVSLLAALGIMAGSLFSFPVASLLVLCLFFGGLIGPWFAKEFVEPDVYARLTTVTVHIDRAWRALAGALVALMPNFGHHNPLGKLVDGQMVRLADVAAAGAVLFYVKGALGLLVGMYFYSRRELAKTIV